LGDRIWIITQQSLVATLLALTSCFLLRAPAATPEALEGADAAKAADAGQNPPEAGSRSACRSGRLRGTGCTLRTDDFGQALNKQLDEMLAIGIRVLAWSVIFNLLSLWMEKMLALVFFLFLHETEKRFKKQLL
jgi:hypothetical protein